MDETYQSNTESHGGPTLERGSALWMRHKEVNGEDNLQGIPFITPLVSKHPNGTTLMVFK